MIFQYFWVRGSCEFLQLSCTSSGRADIYIKLSCTSSGRADIFIKLSCTSSGRSDIYIKLSYTSSGGADIYIKLFFHSVSRTSSSNNFSSIADFSVTLTRFLKVLKFDFFSRQKFFLLRVRKPWVVLTFIG